MKSAHVDFGDFGVSKYVASDQCYGDSRVYVISRRRISRNLEGRILYGFSLCLDKYAFQRFGRISLELFNNGFFTIRPQNRDKNKLRSGFVMNFHCAPFTFSSKKRNFGASDPLETSCFDPESHPGRFAQPLRLYPACPLHIIGHIGGIRPIIRGMARFFYIFIYFPLFLPTTTLRLHGLMRSPIVWLTWTF